MIPYSAAAPLELFGHLVERPDERQRDVQGVGGVDAESRRHGVDDRLAVVGDHDETDQRVELDLVEPVPGRLLHPADLLPGGLGGGVGGRLGPRRPRPEVRR